MHPVLCETIMREYHNKKSRLKTGFFQYNKKFKAYFFAGSAAFTGAGAAVLAGA
jgi:hypothetical protein